jgi:hypothetical protein
MNDMIPNSVGFNNILTTIVYLLQVVAGEKWASVFSLLLTSKDNGIVVVLIFALPVCLSVIVHGYIISTYLYIIDTFRKSEVRTRLWYSPPPGMASH